MNSATNTLHIIAFDVPFPPNYGGIVDVYFKLKSLHEAGIKIIYHCFYYSGHNKPTDQLKKYCEELHYYHRPKNFWRLLFSIKPYIVSSRNNKKLLENLLKDDAPILFDGLQTCFFLNHPKLTHRKKFVRCNNIEHTYYRELSQVERNWVKRKYLDREADRLALFEPQLKNANALFVVAKMDLEHFAAYSTAFHVPPFFNDEHEEKSTYKTGIEGRYVLFQGNLRVRENELAAKYIINEVAPLLKHKIIIAGKSPSAWLRNEASIQENVLLIDSPPSIQMNALIQQAHVNLLLTFQQTGIKLKLLHALNTGKHIVINSKMDDAGIFSDMCEVEDSAEGMAHRIEKLMRQDFTDVMAAERKEKFDKIYNNRLNAKKIQEIIFE